MPRSSQRRARRPSGCATRPSTRPEREMARWCSDRNVRRASRFANPRLVAATVLTHVLDDETPKAGPWRQAEEWVRARLLRNWMQFRPGGEVGSFSLEQQEMRYRWRLYGAATSG